MTYIYTSGYTRSNKMPQPETQVFSIKDKKLVGVGVTGRFAGGITQ